MPASLPADGFPLRIELHDPIALGIVYVVSEYAGTLLAVHGVAQKILEIVAVINVVTQHERGRSLAEELLADQERLRQAIRGWLHRIGEIESPLASIPQQLRETRGVLRGGDDQDVTDTGQHQGAQRVVDHRLVVDGQQLFGYGQGGRVQTGTGATGEDDAFTFHELVSVKYRAGMRRMPLRQCPAHGRAIQASQPYGLARSSCSMRST